MKNILFIGSIVPENMKKTEINSEAANNFQINLTNELKKKFQVNILSYYGYKMKNKPNNFENKFMYIYKYDVLNINILKKIRELKKMISDVDCIIFYNHSYFNDIIKLLISKNKKKYLVLADYTESKEEKNIIKKILSKKAKSEFKKYDGLICLSKNMLKYNKKSINIFGGIDGINYKNFLLPKVNNKIKFFYSGLLNEVTGVDILLEAIKEYREESVEFYFTGKGSLKNKIKEAALIDKRIKYLGFLSKEEFYDRLEESNVLINPRNMNFLQNNNNFPSKILEYLYTGRIILSTKFPGYDCFDDNIIYCDSNAESIKKSLEKIVSTYSKLKRYYYEKNIEKSKEFTWEKQAENIVKFIEGKIN